MQLILEGRFLIYLYQTSGEEETQHGMFIFGYPLREGADLHMAADERVRRFRAFIRRAGIDTVDIQSGSGDFTRSMVTVGKYLTPQLYVSYGYGVFSEEQMLKIRYRISKNWEVETFRGNAMGVDLYYRIDFY